MSRGRSRLGWLGVPGRAAAGRRTVAVHSSIRPRWAGRSVVWCSRAQSSSRPSVAPVGAWGAIDRTRARSGCRWSSRGRGRRQFRGGSWCDRHCSDRARDCPRRQATDLSGAQPIEAEGEDLASGGDLGEGLAAPRADALVRLAQRAATRGLPDGDMCRVAFESKPHACTGLGSGLDDLRREE